MLLQVIDWLVEAISEMNPELCTSLSFCLKIRTEILYLGKFC